MTAETLSTDDCHYQLRNENRLDKDCVFLSIAWDFQRLTYDSVLLKRDVEEIYRQTQQNRKLKIPSLAQHEIGIIALAIDLYTSRSLTTRQMVLCHGITSTFAMIVRHHDGIIEKAKKAKHVEIQTIPQEIDETQCALCHYELSNYFCECSKCEIKFCCYCFEEDAYLHDKKYCTCGKKTKIYLKHHYVTLTIEHEIRDKLQSI